MFPLTLWSQGYFSTRAVRWNIHSLSVITLSHNVSESWSDWFWHHCEERTVFTFILMTCKCQDIFAILSLKILTSGDFSFFIILLRCSPKFAQNTQTTLCIVACLWWLVLIVSCYILDLDLCTFFWQEKSMYSLSGNFVGCVHPLWKVWRFFGFLFGCEKFQKWVFKVSFQCINILQWHYFYATTLFNAFLLMPQMHANTVSLKLLLKPEIFPIPGLIQQSLSQHVTWLKSSFVAWNLTFSLQSN